MQRMRKVKEEMLKTPILSKGFSLNFHGVWFHAHNIYGNYAVGFPSEKNRQQPQAPKPHTDGTKLIMCQKKQLQQLFT